MLFRFASVSLDLTGESGVWNFDNFEHYPGRASLDLNVFITSLAALLAYVFIHGHEVLSCRYIVLTITSSSSCPLFYDPFE